MRTGQVMLREGVLGALLLAASSAAWAEGAKVNITKLRTPSLYNCDDGKKLDPQPWVRRPFPWSAVVPDPPKDFLYVMDENGKPSKVCAKAWAVQTDRPIPVKGECGSVVAQRSAATRGVGEECPNAKK